MSKNKIIAGAGVFAGLAVALAPVATFAADPVEIDKHTDELVITVPVTCAFGNSENNIAGVSHASVADTTWSEAVGTDTYKTDDVADDKLAYATDGTADTHASENTAFRTVNAGTTSDAFAKTTLTVVCNNATGYTIKAVGEDLVGVTDNTVKIPLADSYSKTASGYNATLVKTTVASTADVALEGKINKTNAATASVFAQNTDVSLEDGDVWNVTYGIGVASSQKAQVYHGKVTYTLFKSAPAA